MCHDVNCQNNQLRFVTFTSVNVKIFSKIHIQKKSLEFS